MPLKLDLKTHFNTAAIPYSLSPHPHYFHPALCGKLKVNPFKEPRLCTILPSSLKTKNKTKSSSSGGGDKRDLEKEKFAERSCPTRGDAKMVPLISSGVGLFLSHPPLDVAAGSQSSRAAAKCIFARPRVLSSRFRFRWPPSERLSPRFLYTPGCSFALFLPAAGASFVGSFLRQLIYVSSERCTASRFRKIHRFSMRREGQRLPKIWGGLRLSGGKFLFTFVFQVNFPDVV